MRDVVKAYSTGPLPAFVIFITDGGISQSSEIQAILRTASEYPIFWQFVGLGGTGYGVLEELDTMPGRVVDNANFFNHPLGAWDPLPERFARRRGGQ
jgi:hypothetical protein